ncbi:MAG TPA: sigma-70 family RNA polymerase sigma factor [Pirellulaceae bacterium]|nr:sigma-70 family RNA polymerase sigma factor [Pirellulaceae bacterium]HMO92406.1 sigma-70 family RNA polymerase sigma factor [Pirellulaceae bacterium]HMP69525.1 sigma-70 family RNA polymerase sigma factor [Pirellulaceae bacterium]
MSEPINKIPKDEELIQSTLMGDADAYGQLVIRYQQRLYNSLVQLMRDTIEAEDATQEAFVLALRKLDSFRGQSSFFTWLYRIAFNSAVSRMRKKRPDLTSHQDMSKLEEWKGSSSELPEDRLNREENVLLVQTALGRLNEEHRAILVLREIDEMSYEDLSRVLDLPIGTVRSRLHRARLQLKQEIEFLMNHPKQSTTSSKK